MKIIIIGGGIGGLAAGIALHQSGHEIDIYERASKIEAVGAGLMVATNAMRVLESLGVADALKVISPTLDHVTIRDDKGAALSTVPTAELAEQFGGATLCTHRADLFDVLMSALSPERVHTGADFERYESQGDKVVAHFADGATIEADALIGADGLKSRVREQMFGDQPTRYSGYMCWRGVAHDADAIMPPGQAYEDWGRGARFGLVNIGRGRVYWYATANRPSGHTGGDNPKAELNKIFGHFANPVPKIIEATKTDRIIAGDIADRPPDSRWSDGRVTLLGDAAHPMTPNLGQGACQAIEDAYVIAQCLSETDDVASAFLTYENQRKDRTAWIQNRARQMGAMGQWENGLARTLRDWFIRRTPRSAYERQYSILFKSPVG